MALKTPLEDNILSGYISPQEVFLMKSKKEFWTRIDEEYAVSGLSKREFSRIYGFNYNVWRNFESTQNKMKRSKPVKGAHQFLRLVITEEGAGE